MKRFYIIAGPNGAGKTTASYSILPEILNVKNLLMQMKSHKAFLLLTLKK